MSGIVWLGAYAFNLAALAWIHWFNAPRPADFTWGSQALNDVGQLLILSYLLVFAFWTCCVDLDVQLDPSEDLRTAVRRKISKPFFFYDVISMKNMAPERNSAPLLAGPQTSLRRAVAVSLDPNSLIANIVLVPVIPLIIGIPGLYSIPHGNPGLDVGLPWEVTVYFLLIVWFNAIVEILFALYCKVTAN